MNRLVPLLLCGSAMVFGLRSPPVQAQSVTVRATSALSQIGYGLNWHGRTVARLLDRLYLR